MAASGTVPAKLDSKETEPLRLLELVYLTHREPELLHFLAMEWSM